MGDVGGKALNMILEDPECKVLQNISNLELVECLKLAGTLSSSAFDIAKQSNTQRRHEFWTDRSVWKFGLIAIVAFSVCAALICDSLSGTGQKQPNGRQSGQSGL